MKKDILKVLVKEAEEDKKNSKMEAAKGVAGGTLGAGALYKSVPHITGRDRLYHGTAEKNMANILKNGIKAKFTGQEGSNTEAMKNARPEAFKESLGKTFATNKWTDAKGFAAQSEAGGVTNMSENLDKLVSGLNPFKKNVAKVRTPTWKMKTTENPEIGGLSFKKWRKEVDPSGNAPELALKRAYNGLKNKTTTFVGDIDSKYIKGSDKYQRAGLSEIKEFAKNNPKRFAGGLGLGLAGAAGLGYAGKKAYDKFKEKREDKEKNAYVQLGMNKFAEEESKLDKAKNWIKENPAKVGLGIGAVGGLGLGALGAKKVNKRYDKMMQPHFDSFKKMYSQAEKLNDSDLKRKIEGDIKGIINRRNKNHLKHNAIIGGSGLMVGGALGATLGDKYDQNKEKNAYVQLGINKFAEEESKLDKTKKWVKKHPIAAGTAFGGLSYAAAGRDLMRNKDNLTFAMNDLKDLAPSKMSNSPLLNNRFLAKNLTVPTVAGVGGAAIGTGLAGAGVGAKKLVDKVRNKNREKNATIEKLAADYIDLKKNSRTGEYGTRKNNFKTNFKSDAKKYAPGLAGAGIGGFAANKLTKNKDNKTRNTLLGAAGGGTIGELARQIKKKANVALKGENEAVVTSFSPRKDDEMTEKLKRIIREYENDRG